MELILNINPMEIHYGTVKDTVLKLVELIQERISILYLACKHMVPVLFLVLLDTGQDK
mgnify:CR=1 FL=1